MSIICIVFFIVSKPKYSINISLVLSVLFFSYFYGASILNIGGTLSYLVFLISDKSFFGQLFLSIIPAILESLHVGIVLHFLYSEYYHKNIAKKIRKNGLIFSSICIIITINVVYFIIHSNSYNADISWYLVNNILYVGAGWGVGLYLATLLVRKINNAIGEDVIGLSPCPMNEDDLLVLSNLNKIERSKPAVLVVGAHPDDIEIGAYNLINNENINLFYVTLTHGELGATKSRDSNLFEICLVWKRVIESIESARALNSCDITIASLYDGHLFEKKDDIIKIVRNKLKEIRRLGINDVVVISHGTFDMHSDHISVGEAIRSAARPNAILLYMVIDVSAPDMNKVLSRKENIYCSIVNYSKFSQHMNRYYATQIKRGTVKLSETKDNYEQYFFHEGDSLSMGQQVMELCQMKEYLNGPCDAQQAHPADAPESRR